MQGQGCQPSLLTTCPSIPSQVKSGTIFDNFLITNDEAYAEEFGNETWGVTKVGHFPLFTLGVSWEDWQAGETRY